MSLDELDTLDSWNSINRVGNQSPYFLSKLPDNLESSPKLWQARHQELDIKGAILDELLYPENVRLIILKS